MKLVGSTATTRIVLPYVLISSLWILLSDRLLDVLPIDHAARAQLSVYKGWLFVGVTAALLAGLIRRESAARARQIAERVTVEHALREAHDRVARIVATSPGIVCSFGMRPDGSTFFPFGGERIGAHFGIPEARLAEDASAFLALAHPDDLGGLQASIAESAQRLTPWRHEWRVRDPVRGLVWVEGHSMPHREPDGSTVWHGIATEVSWRKQAEEALRESEERLRLALDAAHMGTFDWDIPANHIVWSRWHEELWAFAAGEFPGTYEAFAGRVHPEDLPSVDREVQRCIAARQLFASEFRVVWPDGSVHWVVGRGEFTFDRDARPARMRGVVVEITDRKRAEAEVHRLNEELRQHAAVLEQRVAERTAELAEARDRAQAADRAKSAFLATMSHELRTPLNSVIGFTGLLLKELAGPLNDEQVKQLQMVRRSGQHLLALINDVLDMSKIEAGELTVTATPFDLADAVRRVANAVAPLADTKRLALVIDVRTGVGTITSDRRRVEQVLLNLLGNAIKFTDHGSVTLTVEPVPGAIRLSVTDTGVGIRKENLARLFRPFQQLDSGLSRQHEGTGLGLAICQRLVERLGGTISVESRPGHGSTFSFTLPAGQTQAC